MSGASIGIIDSGIGGIFVLNELNKTLCGKNLIYCGDNKNVPYGNKSRRELLSLAISSVVKLAEYNPRCIVLGCNTLSVSVRSDLESFAGVPVFGVFPPVEKEVIKGKKTLLLATERTCGFYSDVKGLAVSPQKTLAGSIEKCKFNKNFDFLIENKKNFNDYDSVILGCTHYELIKKRLFSMGLTTSFLSGIKNTVKKVKDWDNCQKTGQNDRKNQIIFISSSALENKKFFLNYNF